MKFSYNWLKELVNFKESPEKLAEILNIRSFEVETVEKVGGDFALDAKIPTNRTSDAANHIGLAHEIAAILGKHKTQIPRPTSPASELAGGRAKYKQSTNNTIQIKISKPGLCPRYTAQELEIENIGPSPRWMQERLITCGLRPIDAVVDITNYVMLESGQPLHAFDLDKIKGGKMVIREAKNGEELTTLDGTKHRLTPGAIVIADAERLIDLAGIMGGANSAVSSKTKRILLQAAAFDPVRIYKSARALNFSSAASKIYSAGTDPNQTEVGLERASELSEKILGAKRIGRVYDLYPKKTLPAHILFRPEHASRIVGEGLTSSFYKSALALLGFGVKKKERDLLIEVPTIRRDIEIEEDLLEEAARIFGYEKIAPKLPEAPIVPPPPNEEYFWEERVRDILAGAGFAESFLYEFTGDQELGQFFADPSGAPKLENPMNPETKYLVPRVSIKYASSAAENLRNFDTVKIFGIAKSFGKKGGNVAEHKDLVLAFAQKGTSGTDEFYQLKGVLDHLLESMGISEYWYDDIPSGKTLETRDKLFHPYRKAEIKVGDEKIGNIGEIHPVILENIKSRARIVAAEIDFEKLWRLARAEQEFRPIGKYPAIIRDIAVVVPSETRADDVQEIIENIGGKLLVDSDLFDYFQDEQMREEEEKSLAFHLIFQSPERTLKDGEVNEIVERITKALEEKEWEVRK